MQSEPRDCRAARDRRASVPDTQVAVWLYEGALSRAGEEYGATGDAICAGKSVSGEASVIGDGINPPAAGWIAQ